MGNLRGSLSAIIVLLTVASARGQHEGERCWKNGVWGKCTLIYSCQSAISDFKKGIRPQICSYIGMDSVVCCSDSVWPSPVVVTPRPYVLTTIRPRSKPTTEYTPPTYDYVINARFFSNESTCAPIEASATSPKTGQKAWDKCIEYQERLVYPCVKSNALSADVTNEKVRVSECPHDADQLIVGGKNATSAEFPHMALLGYSKSDEILWSCGGSIISERFILTAGHCTYSVDAKGPAKYALVGILSRSETTDPSQRYTLETPIRHPDYKSPSQYHDIALLRTTTEIALGPTVVPACLHVDRTADDQRALASGWGYTKHKGSISDVLQKVILHKFSDSECSRLNPKDRYMKRGFDPSTQICYGDHDQSKDTCTGDSGGPLQLKSQKIKCMYTIVGVTSVGKVCGFAGQPGVYTKVTAYVPWIESVVWPN